MAQKIIRRFRSLFLSARYFLGPVTLPFYGRQLERVIDRVKPDLVHALRVPFEGMLAAYTPVSVPLVASIWGNDLTLHAPHSRAMGQFTRQTLQRADGLHTDAQRDLRLAYDVDFRPPSRTGSTQQRRHRP